jgi:hypothetical protein
MNPRTDYGYVNACDVLALQARYDVDHGIDPRPSASAAVARCDESIRVDPGYADTHRLRADALSVVAEWSLRNGADPRTEIDEARRSAASCLRIDPSSPDGLRASAHAAELAEALAGAAHAPRKAAL